MYKIKIARLSKFIEIDENGPSINFCSSSFSYVLFYFLLCFNKKVSISIITAEISFRYQLLKCCFICSLVKYKKTRRKSFNNLQLIDHLNDIDSIISLLSPNLIIKPYSSFFLSFFFYSKKKKQSKKVNKKLRLLRKTYKNCFKSKQTLSKSLNFNYIDIGFIKLCR